MSAGAQGNPAASPAVARGPLARTPFTALAGSLSTAALIAGRDRAIALYGGLLIVVAILFGGPNAMRAADVVRLMEAHLPFRLALWGAWLVAATPLVRAILVMPSTFFLRALPVPAWQPPAVHALHLALVEVPWLVLGLRGAGVAGGLAMAVTAAGLHAAVVAPPRRAPELGAAIVLGGLVLVGVPAVAALPLALAGATVAIKDAWRRAPELSPASGRAGIALARRYPPLALAAAYLIVVWRAERALVARALAVCAIGGAAAAAALGSNGVTAPSTIARVMLAVTAPPLAIAATALGAGVLRCEGRERWLLDSLGAAPGPRAWAALVAASAAGLPCAALIALVVARGTGASPAFAGRLIVDAAVWSVTLSASALAALRAAEAHVGAADRFALGAMGAATALLVVAAALAGEGALAVAPLAVAGALLTGHATAALSPSGSR